MKLATNVDTQIKILKERGLIIDDENKARSQLLDIGYYRLGFYAYHFQDKKHKFKDNVCFSDLIDLYYLDTNLKHILMKYITRIEINFRTKIIYHTSNEYPKTPTWFADSKVLDKNFVKDLPNFYNQKFKQNNKTIRYHHHKYPNDIYAPAWKTLEFFTFGSILMIYKSLKSHHLKRKIAQEYGIKSPKTLINFLETTLFVRNISAHGGTFYDCQTPIEILNTSLVPVNQSNNHSPYSSIRIILYMINEISENRHDDMKYEIRKLLQKYSNNHKVISTFLNCSKFYFDFSQK